MSKRITMLMLVLLVAVTAFAQTEAASEKAPRLTLVDPLKDFGTVAKGEKLTHAFQIKNTGTADLEILAARPACGCTVADFDKVIKPGQTGKIVSAVDTAAFSGPISKSVTIETNDPAAPTAQITISATVKPYVEVHPVGYVRFNLLQGEVDSETLTVYSEETEPFEIVRVETPQEWIKVDAKKLDKPLPNLGRAGQTQYGLIVTVGGPDARTGPLSERVRIVTNSKHQPEYFVNVTGVIRPTYRVDPAGGVNFGEVAPNDPNATRSFVVKSLNMKAPESFVVTKAESNVPGVKAAVKPTATKGEYEITLAVDDKAKAGNIDGVVKVYTTDKVRPVADVPVKGTIKAKS